MREEECLNPIFETKCFKIYYQKNKYRKVPLNEDENQLFILLTLNLDIHFVCDVMLECHRFIKSKNFWGTRSKKVVMGMGIKYILDTMTKTRGKSDGEILERLVYTQNWPKETSLKQLDDLREKKEVIDKFIKIKEICKEEL